MDHKISPQTKRDVLEALRGRYGQASRMEKSQILEEFVAIAGCHRKHAIRLLEQRRAGFVWFPGSRRTPSPRPPDLFRGSPRGARRSMGSGGSHLRQTAEGDPSRSDLGHGAAQAFVARPDCARARSLGQSSNHRPVAESDSQRRLPRHQAETCYQAQQADPDPNIRRLERAGTRVPRDRLCVAWRQLDARRVLVEFGGDRRVFGLGGDASVGCPRAIPGRRGPLRSSAPIPMPIRGIDSDNDSGLHQRDTSRLLPGTEDRIYPFASLPEERPSLDRAKERRGYSAIRGLRALHGAGCRPVSRSSIPDGSSVRELFSAIVQAFVENA